MRNAWKWCVDCPEVDQNGVGSGRFFEEEGQSISRPRVLAAPPRRCGSSVNGVNRITYLHSAFWKVGAVQMSNQQGLLVATSPPHHGAWAHMATPYYGVVKWNKWSSPCGSSVRPAPLYVRVRTVHSCDGTIEAGACRRTCQSRQKGEAPGASLPWLAVPNVHRRRLGRFVHPASYSLHIHSCPWRPRTIIPGAAPGR